MTIRKGSVWGTPRKVGVNARQVSTDSELAAAAYQIHLGGQNVDNLLLRPSAGDVLRTLGVSSERDTSDQIVYPFDLGVVQRDGGAPMPFIAHVIARNRLWSGKFAAVMNVGWSGDNYFGPRSHPNDGLLDITEGSLSFQQRMLAKRRLRSGAHLPHPDLRTTRRSTHRIEFERPTVTYVDGVVVGCHSLLDVELISDAFNVVA